MAAYDLKLLDGFDNIFGCEVFFKEFRKLFKKDRETEKKYQKWLNRQFDYLAHYPSEIFLQTKNFELITSVDSEWPIYSIRHPESTGNPRILFSTITDNSGQTHILLLAFKELHDDYQRYLPTAKKRLKEIIRIIEEKGNGD